jgi:hypothetical protein
MAGLRATAGSRRVPPHLSQLSASARVMNDLDLVDVRSVAVDNFPELLGGRARGLRHVLRARRAHLVRVGDETEPHLSA